MNYTYQITGNLKEYSGAFYKMIELTIVKSEGKFGDKTNPLEVRVIDGTNTAYSFIKIISGNQKELIAYFTIDAFTGFSANATIQFGYGGQFTESIANVDVQNIPALSSLLSAIPHQIADNNWLASIS